jgi:hypothetical protein
MYLNQESSDSGSTSGENVGTGEGTGSTSEGRRNAGGGGSVEQLECELCYYTLGTQTHPVGDRPPEGITVPVGGTEGTRVMVDKEVVGTQVVMVMTEMLGAGELWYGGTTIEVVVGVGEVTGDTPTGVLWV